MMNHFLSLKKHFNTRMIYPKGTPITEAGVIDGMYFPQEDFAEYDKPTGFNEFEYILSCNDQKNDCIRCEGQVIKDLNIIGDHIYFLGFSIWGGFQDIFALTYINQKKENVKVKLWDTGINYESEYYFDEYNKENINVNLIFKKIILFGRPLYCYMFKHKLLFNEAIETINFPKNEFMHILAITITNTEQGGNRDEIKTEKT